MCDQVSRNGVVLGANLTLSAMVPILKEAGHKFSGLAYLAKVVAPHIETIGSTAIRNVSLGLRC